VNKTLHVAVREFIATVATKGFIIGIVVTPVIMVIAIFGMKLLMNEKAPQIEGEVAVIDPTGEVFGELREYLRPEAITERRDDYQERIQEQIPEGVKRVTEAAGKGEATRMAIEAMVLEAPKLDLVELDRSEGIEEAKNPLREGDAKTGGRLALVVVHEDAVVKPADQKQFGKYDLFVKKGLDDRITDEIKRGLYKSIVDARVREAGLDRERIDALTSIGRIRSTTVTAEGEEQTNEIATFLMPMGFMLLLFISVLSGGQYLMTTTIEEKSSRVVEVLLSAVSPMQLMTGKIIGQMCVGFVILGVYGGMGVAALVAFAAFGLLNPMDLVYLVIFYLIAYFVMASLMAAIGAAVNEMREAQTFMTPVMMTMIIPWILWAPISRDPNSVFATTMSFVPPLNTFVMMLRRTATTPPPDWQVWLSIAIGLASAYGALWFAAKVFRVGLLMYGKPPDFKTLIRWVRMS